MSRDCPLKLMRGVAYTAAAAVLMGMISIGSSWAGESPLASYVHVATADNTKAYLSQMQNLAAQDPKAIVMVTPVCNPKNIKMVANPYPLGVCWLNTAWSGPRPRARASGWANTRSGLSLTGSEVLFMLPHDGWMGSSRRQRAREQALPKSKSP